MPSTVPETQLGRLSDLISARLGLYFPRERWPDLTQRVGAAARELGFADVEGAIEWLASAPLSARALGVLAGHLTVGETYFFREKESLEALETHILPALVRSRRGGEQRLRIWSAGCSTGEEPYSIAILLSRMLSDRKDWQVTILATDINPRFLKKAAEGLYGEWAFRGTPSWVKQRYFRKTEARQFALLPRIRDMVTFSYLNLAEDVYPSFLTNTSACDVIFCRNVLMYFAPEEARRVVQRLHRSLVAGGWLIVSPAEASYISSAPFATADFSCAIARKGDAPAEQTAVRAGGPLPNEVAEVSPSTSFDRIPAFTPAKNEETRQTSPREPTRYENALALYQQGCYAEAIQALADTQGEPETTSMDEKAIALLARAYGNQGDLGEARRWCEKGLASDKLNPRFHYLRATILLEQGELAEAAASLRRALYLDQDFALAHFALGSLARRQGRPGEAQKHFANALSLLGTYGPEDILPEAEGLTAGRIAETIRALIPLP